MKKYELSKLKTRSPNTDFIEKQIFFYFGFKTVRTTYFWTELHCIHTISL